ncbi:LPS-assembly protein LptD [Massilia sp. MB5]|uniref:LPS-assembly protein LptD n=1 Tax=unclassified Massilia TaxID=2609279 RepID=UPI00067CCE88|nr:MULTISPECIES: LPS-assembly protein LptD [unclassified Massilia]AKU23630.1 OstA organic solvent tolerance protein [Massilia sp. NR 4-1]UMR31443.1 LPS-assembly protein LptD [Massilia sp. MB5]
MSWFTPPKNSQKWAFALTALAAAAAATAHAQTTASKQRPQRVEDPNAVTTIRAEDIGGRPERILNLERDVEVVRDQTRVTSDKACYKQVEAELEAQGNVRIWRYGDYYTADELQLNMETGKGFMLHPTYRMELNNAQGKARRIDFLNEDEALVIDGTYSTCQGPNPDWYLRSSTLNLDSGRDVGTAGGTVLYFKDVPFLGTPGMSFSLSGARRSGWLPPIPGFGSKGAAEVVVPYYFNIAPNRDLTVYPKIIPRRGLQMGAVGRYMGETEAGEYEGRTHIEYLPHDKEAGKDRWMLHSTHTQAIAPDWTYGWNVRAASDDEYPNDFSKTVANSAERQLLRELRTDYRREYWSLTARVQKYQVLQDPEAKNNKDLTVSRPYDRLPAINLHAARYDVGGFDWQLDSELTRFWHPTEQRGTRVVAVPQLSYPIIGASYFVTPKVMLNASAYQLEAFKDPARGDLASRSLRRAVPTVSIDSGLEFERSASLFGRAVTQTLEPRLFYVYTPYREQKGFPNFDTAEATFNLSQIFSESRFIGSDRVGDANQVTAGVVSRFLEASGAERLRLSFGQRFYFNEQRIQLTDDAKPRYDTRSDTLLAAAGRISETWGFDSAVQYNPGERRVISTNHTLQWQPGQKKVLNLGYRFLRDSFKNADISGQWPLSQRWYGVARVSYSLKDKTVLESLVGLEYNGDCWVFRMGAQRFVTSANKASTPIFFQLELNGLSKFGVGNPLEVMKNSIPGYQRLNEGYGR